MDKWLTAVPKGLLVMIVIGAGILFIVLNDPPKTLCDTQLEVLKASQDGFLTPKSKSKIQTTPGFQTHIAQCKVTNSPGGCYEFFMKMKRLIDDIKGVPKECAPVVESGGVLNKDAVEPALMQTLELLTQLAWGEKPPTSYNEKMGWLDAADMTFFCDLSRTVKELYGREPWEKFQEQMFTKLPGAKDMTRKDAWEAMLLSVNCARYL